MFSCIQKIYECVLFCCFIKHEIAGLQITVSYAFLMDKRHSISQLLNNWFRFSEGNSISFFVAHFQPIIKGLSLDQLHDNDQTI